MPSLPKGLRIYAIGDIHGRKDLLDAMLASIARQDRDRPDVERRLIIFLGDYVDRGPQSKQVIERLLQPMPEGFEAELLMGNHEQMMRDALTAPHANTVLWLLNGGERTVQSYKTDAPGRFDLDASVPDSHKAFLERLALTAEHGDYLFVHAGIRPGIPLDRQSRHDLLWIREPFLSHRGDFGRLVVHGHTPREHPDVRENRIGLDTGAWLTGRLTALMLENDERKVLQVEGPPGPQ